MSLDFYEVERDLLSGLAMPLDVYEVERDLLSGLAMPLDFYKVNRVLFLRVCPSTFINSNEICFQAFAGRLL